MMIFQKNDDFPTKMVIFQKKYKSLRFFETFFVTIYNLIIINNKIINRYEKSFKKP